MLNLKRPLISFDLETTGVNIAKDKIVQIALTKTHPNGGVESKNYLINPLIPIPKDASDVHHITDEMVADKPSFDKYANGMFKFFEGCDIIGFNSDSFDIPLLSEEFTRCGITFPSPDTKTIDVYSIEKKVNSHKLTDTYKRYTGKDLDGAHDAMNDVNATNDVFEAQIKAHNLPNDIDEIIKLYTDTESGKSKYDFAGKMYKLDGNIYWSFGKNKDKIVSEDRGYCNWFLNSDFPTDSKNKLLEVLDKDR